MARRSALAVARHFGKGIIDVNLWTDFLTNEQRVIHKWKHYFPIYERHFRDYVYKTVTFIEIGCGEGGSLQMWKRYFGPHARIVGLDTNPGCKAFEEDQIEIRIGEQQDTRFLHRVVEEFGTADIVLDDGSHMMSHVGASFNFLYPKLSTSGIYMVEDLHTSYWEEFEGGLNRTGTFIQLAKHLIDELNADHVRRLGADGVHPQHLVDVFLRQRPGFRAWPAHTEAGPANRSSADIVELPLRRGSMPPPGACAIIE